MQEAYKQFWNDYFNFSGRINRNNFWLNVLMNYIIIFSLLFLIAVSEEQAPLYYLIMMIYFVITIIPNISMQVRRLHDVNQSGIVLVLYFLPVIGPIILLVLYASPTAQTVPLVQNNQTVTTSPAQASQDGIIIFTIIILIIIFLLLILPFIFSMAG